MLRLWHATSSKNEGLFPRLSCPMNSIVFRLVRCAHAGRPPFCPPHRYHAVEQANRVCLCMGVNGCAATRHMPLAVANKCLAIFFLAVLEIMVVSTCWPPHGLLKRLASVVHAAHVPVPYVREG